MTSAITNAILSRISAGFSDSEILSSVSSTVSPFAIEKLRELHCADTFGNKMRSIHVTFIDDLEAGLAYIYNNHSSKSICRITDYSRRYQKVYFDAYHGESVIVFDNFNSDIPVETFVGYFRNGYPLSLPARKFNRTACYTEVFILSNSSPDHLYPLRCMCPSPDAHILMDHIDTFLSYDFSTKVLKEKPVLPSERCLQ